MNSAPIGMIAGILLVLAATTGGVTGFLFALVLGTIGLAAGAHLDGSIDLSAMLRGRGRG